MLASLRPPCPTPITSLSNHGLGREVAVPGPMPGVGRRIACTALLSIAATVASAADDLVATPGGYRHQAHVHKVPPGSLIRHTAVGIQVTDRQGHLLRVDQAPAIVPDLGSGWICYAAWNTNAATLPFYHFASTLTVPPAPAADNGQTIFLFEGLQGWNSANQGEIIQPVLQWGPAEDGGGAYWAVASWYVTPTDAYFTTPVPVSAGQSLQGEIQYVPFTGPLPAGVHEYSISFAGSLAAQTQLTALPEIPQFECVTTLEA